MERFKSQLGQNVVLFHLLRFLDSFQFMWQSLHSLAKTVDKNEFKLLRAGFLNIADDLFQRLTNKKFFPVQRTISTLLKSLMSPHHVMGLDGKKTD